MANLSEEEMFGLERLLCELTRPLDEEEMFELEVLSQIYPQHRPPNMTPDISLLRYMRQCYARLHFLQPRKPTAKSV